MNNMAFDSIVVRPNWSQLSKPRGQCDVLLLDFCKAFDKVPHSHLFNKLQFYGIQGPLLTWIMNFLSDRSQQIILKFNNKWSNSCNILSGILQGTVLTSLLFLIFINDLPFTFWIKCDLMLMMLYCIHIFTLKMIVINYRMILTLSPSGHTNDKYFLNQKMWISKNNK